MPVSSAVRRLRGKWPELIERVRLEAVTIPEEGLTLLDFAVSYLDEVPPGTLEEVVRALARKGAIWIGKDRGVEKVFAKKPVGLSRAMGGDAKRDALLGSIAPNVYAAAIAAFEVEKRPDDNEALARRAEAVRRIVGKCNRALQDGMTLSEIRLAIKVTFGSKLSATLYYVEPALQVTSQIGSLSSHLIKRERVQQKGLTDRGRVLSYVQSRGKYGISRSDLLRYVRPAIKAGDLTGVLSELHEQGMIEPLRMLAPGAYRKATRWFSSDVGVPDLDSVGRAIVGT